MRTAKLMAYLQDGYKNREVLLRIRLDFLDGQPEITAGFDVSWGCDDELFLNASVRLGDIALEAGWEGAADMPCDGCRLDEAADWVFEHYDIDTLTEELCDRPGNVYRCCFLPEPPSDDGEQVSIGAHSDENDGVPF